MTASQAARAAHEDADGRGVAGSGQGPEDTDGARADVVTLGESMVTFLPTRPGRLADVPSFERGIGGAESNVACGLARAGHRVTWVSRVGADGFGDHLVERIASYGVDVGGVQRDPRRPTGIYFRTAGERAVLREAPPAADEACGDATGPTARDASAAPAVDTTGPRASAGAHDPSTGDGRGAGPAAGGGPGPRSAAGCDTHPRPAAGSASGAGAAVKSGPGPVAAERGGRGAGPAGEPGAGAGAAVGSGSGPEPAVEGGPVAGAPGALAEVVYYRAGSAASAMSPVNMPLDALRAGRVLHLSGITAALSPDCRALLRELVTARPAVGPLVSFDVNYRVSLWRDAAEAGAVLGELARASDLVFVGDDEAEAAWGLTGGPQAIRAALPEPRLLVVKQGAHGATVFHRPAAVPGVSDAVTFVPALRVDVVAPVGAGDAFAAGFLSATLRGLPVPARIRHGHLMAAAALTVPGDLGTPPDQEVADRLAALDDGQWGRLRLGPGWTRAARDRFTPPQEPTAQAGDAAAGDAKDAVDAVDAVDAEEEVRIP